MVASGISIKRETYLAVLMDRESNGPVIVASPAGGMDIEAVAEKTPHLIFKHPVDIMEGLSEGRAREIAKNLDFEGEELIGQVGISELFCAYNQVATLYM